MVVFVKFVGLGVDILYDSGQARMTIGSSSTSLGECKNMLGGVTLDRSINLEYNDIINVKAKIKTKNANKSPKSK